jgi:hypothetical protein
MTPRRFFFIMVGLLSLFIILIFGGTFAGNSLLQNKSKKLLELKAQNKAIEEQQVSLIQAKKDIEKYAPLNEITRSIVPQDKDQAKTVREINKIAEDNGIALKEIRFTTSTLGQAAPKAAEGSTGSTPTSTAPAITQVRPVEGITGVYSLEITISPARSVSYESFLRFLEGLEQNRRTAHVAKVAINPSKVDNSLTFTLTLNAYVKP